MRSAMPASAVAMAAREADVERAHEGLFLETLGRTVATFRALRYQMSQRSAIAMWQA